MWVTTSYIHLGMNMVIIAVVNVLLFLLAVAVYIMWKSETMYKSRNWRSGWFAARGVHEYEGPERGLVRKTVHILNYSKEIYSK